MAQPATGKREFCWSRIILMLGWPDADASEFDRERPRIVRETKFARRLCFVKTKAQSDSRPDPGGRRNDDAPIAGRCGQRPSTDALASRSVDDDFARGTGQVLKDNDRKFKTKIGCRRATDFKH